MKPIQQRDRHRLAMLLAGFLFGTIFVPALAMAEQTDPGGGIGGTGITGFGVVQKFGSIFVNGREFFFDKHSRVSREGVAISQDALRLGDIVLVQGSSGGNTGTGTIAKVDARIALQGRVQDIDVAQRTFRILGQTVHLGSIVHGDAGTAKPSINQIRIGEPLVVSGLARADGSWMATRIVSLHAADTKKFIVRGSVASLDRTKGVVILGMQAFELAPAGIAAGIRHGATVRISGVYDHGRAVVTAIRTESQVAFAAGHLVEMSGYVQTLSGTGALTANDTILRYNQTTIVRQGKIGDLRPNSPVAVRGELNADGSIAVRAMIINIDPHEVVLPERETALRPLGPDERHEGSEKGRPGVEKPEMEKPEFEKPEFEKPEMDKPSIDYPGFDRPELPMLGH
jgi:hypothetical protein